MIVGSNIFPTQNIHHSVRLFLVVNPLAGPDHSNASIYNSCAALLRTEREPMEQPALATDNCALRCCRI